MQLYFLYIINKFVAIVICLLLAEPLKRVFLTLTIICRNIMKAKELVWQLRHLQIPQDTMDSLIIRQFRLAKSLHYLKWIKAVRKEATVIYSDRWIDTHLPLPGGKKRQVPKSGRSSSSSSQNTVLVNPSLYLNNLQCVPWEKWA